MIILSAGGTSIQGFIYNKIIALPEAKPVAVILGHCVFGTNGTVKAKYFQNTLFSLDGKILAKEQHAGKLIQFNESEFMQTAWELITKVKDHQCLHIEPSGIWADQSLYEYFL